MRSALELVTLEVGAFTNSKPDGQQEGMVIRIQEKLYGKGCMMGPGLCPGCRQSIMTRQWEESGNKYSTLTLLPSSSLLSVLTKGQAQLAVRGQRSSMVFVYKPVSLSMCLGGGNGSRGASGRSSSVTIHV